MQLNYMTGMKKLLLLLMITGIALQACKKEPKIYDPSSKLDGINATWVLNKVTQTDPSDKDNPLDISYVYTEGNPIELTINSSDLSYSFNQSNPIFMGNNGTWKFDDNDFPTQIEITHDGKTDVLPLLRTVRAVDAVLTFQLDKFCDGGTKTTSYQYTFIRK